LPGPGLCAIARGKMTTGWKEYAGNRKNTRLYGARDDSAGTGRMSGPDAGGKGSGHRRGGGSTLQRIWGLHGATAHSDGFVVLILTIKSGPSAGKWKSYQKDIVLPSGTRMTRMNPGSVWHVYGHASAGIALYYWLDPTNVSFKYLTFGEGTCPATAATGIYVTTPPGNHPQNTFGAILGGNQTTGCRVEVEDHASTEYFPWAPGGTFTWSIPTEYIDDTSTRHSFGSNSIMTPTIQANGYTTIWKAGQAGSAAVDAPTSGW